MSFDVQLFFFLKVDTLHKVKEGKKGNSQNTEKLLYQKKNNNNKPTLKP